MQCSRAPRRTDTAVSVIIAVFLFVCLFLFISPQIIDTLVNFMSQKFIAPDKQPQCLLSCVYVLRFCSCGKCVACYVTVLYQTASSKPSISRNGCHASLLFLCKYRPSCSINCQQCLTYFEAKIVVPFLKGLAEN